MTELTGGPSQTLKRGGQADAAGSAMNTWVWPLVMSLLWLSGILIWQWNAHQPDFSALYFAATAYRTGNIAEVYAASDLFFDGTVSPYWSQIAFDLGYNGKWLYPYVYPPLWAALLAPASEAISLTWFTRLGLLFQAPLIPLSVVLAHRLTGSRLNLTLWMGISLTLVAGSIIGLLAVMQNQPQILVTFLILLAFERQKSSHPLVAGTALALASALKLYPAVLVLFWVVRGERKAVLWFAITGAALGITSLVIAGIDMHLVFLERLKGLADIVLGVSTATGLDTLMYQIWYALEVADAFRATRGGSDTPILQGFVAVQPGWFGPVIYLFFATSLTAMFYLMSSQVRSGDLATTLSIVIIVMSISAPLSWYYHVLPALLMAPVLVERFSMRSGILVLVGFSVLTSYALNNILATLPLDFLITPFVGIVAYLMLIAAFWVARAPDK